MILHCKDSFFQQKEALEGELIDHARKPGQREDQVCHRRHAAVVRPACKDMRAWILAGPDVIAVDTAGTAAVHAWACKCSGPHIFDGEDVDCGDHSNVEESNEQKPHEVQEILSRRSHGVLYPWRLASTHKKEAILGAELMRAPLSGQAHARDAYCRAVDTAAYRE